MINISVPVRNTICLGVLRDIDIKNAHPVFLEWVLSKLKNVNPDCYSALTEYNDNRAEYYDIKDAILSVINGSSVESALQNVTDEKMINFVKKVKSQCVRGWTLIKKHKWTAVHKIRVNNPGKDDYKLLSLFLQTIEANIIEYVVKILSELENPVEVSALCHDGFMISTDYDNRFDEILQLVNTKCRSKWSGMKLWFVEKPMLQGFDLPDDYINSPEIINPKEIENVSKFDSQYNFYDFMSYLCKTVFDSQLELLEYIADNINKYARIIQGDEWSIAINVNGFVKLCKGPVGSTRYLEGGKTVVRRLFEGNSALVFTTPDLLERIQVYTGICSSPHDSDVEKGYCNIFPGIKATEVDVIDYDKIDPLLKHILWVLASGDQEVFHSITLILNRIVRCVQAKQVLLLYSEKQGAGKTCLFEKIIIPFILGPTISKTVKGLTPLVQKHNGVILGQHLILANEISTDVRWITEWDKFKSDITDEYLHIEPKGRESIQTLNNLNYVMTTNHSQSVRIEESDRRFFCVEVSPHMIGNREYWDTLQQCYNQDCANHFYTWLKQLDSSNDLLPIPMTSLKTEMIQNAKSSFQTYIESFPRCLEGWPTLEDFKLDGNTLTVGVKQLCQDYHNYTGIRFTLSSVNSFRCKISRKWTLDPETDTVSTTFIDKRPKLT